MTKAQRQSDLKEALALTSKLQSPQKLKHTSKQERAALVI